MTEPLIRDYRANTLPLSRLTAQLRRCKATGKHDAAGADLCVGKCKRCARLIDWKSRQARDAGVYS